MIAEAGVAGGGARIRRRSHVEDGGWIRRETYLKPQRERENCVSSIFFHFCAIK